MSPRSRPEHAASSPGTPGLQLTALVAGVLAEPAVTDGARIETFRAAIADGSYRFDQALTASAMMHQWARA